MFGPNIEDKEASIVAKIWDILAALQAHSAPRYFGEIILLLQTPLRNGSNKHQKGGGGLHPPIDIRFSL